MLLSFGQCFPYCTAIELSYLLSIRFSTARGKGVVEAVPRIEIVSSWHIQVDFLGAIGHATHRTEKEHEF